MVDRRPFTLLNELRVIERRQHGAVNSSQGYFKFDDHVLTNLQLNYTKPVCIEEFFKLKSEIAQLIYSHIDLMLFDKGKYERRTRELFNDLGLKNEEYAHMYERKRAIERALRELHGIRLSSNVLTSASLEKTADGKDYKVSFSKGTVASLEAAAIEKLGESAPGVVINNYSAPKSQLTQEAEELVRYFYRLFFSVDSHFPQSKETAQALSLITQHGAEKSRRIVEFAHEEAARSAYAIQHFGAVLSYTSRALASKDRQRPIGDPARGGANPARPALDEEPMERGKARLAYLTPEQHEARFASTKEILFRAQPFLARIGTGGSNLHQRAVRARMIRDLEHEIMDLTIVGGKADPATVRRNLRLQNLPV